MTTGRLVEPSDPEVLVRVRPLREAVGHLVGGLHHRRHVHLLHQPQRQLHDLCRCRSELRLNDAKWLGDFALNPSLLFAFETKGEALVSDDNKGIYMGLGLAPGYTFFADSPTAGQRERPDDVRVQRQGLLYGQREEQTWVTSREVRWSRCRSSSFPADFGNWSLRAGVQFSCSTPI